jgi:hypothetical protein
MAQGCACANAVAPTGAITASLSEPRTSIGMFAPPLRLRPVSGSRPFAAPSIRNGHSGRATSSPSPGGCPRVPTHHRASVRVAIARTSVLPRHVARASFSTGHEKGGLWNFDTLCRDLNHHGGRFGLRPAPAAVFGEKGSHAEAAGPLPVHFPAFRLVRL